MEKNHWIEMKWLSFIVSEKKQFAHEKQVNIEVKLISKSTGTIIISIRIIIIYGLFTLFSQTHTHTGLYLQNISSKHFLSSFPFQLWYFVPFRVNIFIFFIVFYITFKFISPRHNNPSKEIMNLEKKATELCIVIEIYIAIVCLSHDMKNCCIFTVS